MDFLEIRSRITLIPLSNGHNGKMKPEEMKLFEEVMAKYDMLRPPELSASFEI